MQFLTANKYFGILIFPLFLLANMNLTHPLQNDRFSVGMIGCLVFICERSKSEVGEVHVKESVRCLDKNFLKTRRILESADKAQKGHVEVKHEFKL